MIMYNEKGYILSIVIGNKISAEEKEVLQKLKNVPHAIRKCSFLNQNLEWEFFDLESAECELGAEEQIKKISEVFADE